MLWCGKLWYGMVCHGMVWYGMLETDVKIVSLLDNIYVLLFNWFRKEALNFLNLSLLNPG